MARSTALRSACRMVRLIGLVGSFWDLSPIRAESCAFWSGGVGSSMIFCLSAGEDPREASAIVSHFSKNGSGFLLFISPAQPMSNTSKRTPIAGKYVSVCLFLKVKASTSCFFAFPKTRGAFYSRAFHNPSSRHAGEGRYPDVVPAEAGNQFL
ncbi:MAG: hypothetical protein BWX52_01938 [Bacteroidetes bacterium ADurb.Bin013]|nr:MAG: hypothetical protein BWX52_01938 [Bacteroidetes bacterium ADurb.Bin013]